MKRLNDLKLSKRNKEKVIEWFNDWIDHFKEDAQGREGNVFRNDFKNMDIFYYTNCQDIINKGNEDDDDIQFEIRRVKRDVLMQIFLKYLMGEDINKKGKCNHCGSNERIVDSYNYGSFTYCPDCGMLCPYLHPGHYDDSMDSILDRIKRYEKIGGNDEDTRES